MTGPAFAAACLLLFAGTWVLTARVTVPWRFLYPLGLRSNDFFSADYWPLIAERDQMLNAGVDINGFSPVTLEELIENNRRFKDSCSHNK